MIKSYSLLSGNLLEDEGSKIKYWTLNFNCKHKEKQVIRELQEEKTYSRKKLTLVSKFGRNVFIQTHMSQ